ncbi:MAG: ribosome maturation factor RimM, partial [Acidimicrobiales bacterium]
AEPSGEGGGGALILVGEILRAHGMRGEVAVRVLSENPRRFQAGARLLVGDGEEATAKRVAEARAGSSGMIVRFEGDSDRNEAERLRGALLFVPASELPELDEDSFWPHELVGLAVFGPAGEPIGTLREVVAREGQDLWEIETPAGPVLLPAARELVRSVDTSAGTVVIDPPEGLLGPLQEAER